MKKIFIYIFLLCLSVKSVSQVNEIGGTVNEYYEVTTVFDTYVQLGENPTDLQAGDKVILIQMTGINVINSGTEWMKDNLSGTSTTEEAGTFEMLAVGSVDDVLDRVAFTVTIDPAKYSSIEKIQLVKIYEADNATVTTPVTAKEWDGTTGGVIAMVIFKKLILNDSINASTSGFRGGNLESGYNNVCRDFNPDTFYFETFVSGIAGSKGEGIIEMSVGDTYTKGPGASISGGGGGLGYFAGGAGGSHWGSGGNGGIQKLGCSTGNKYARGGEHLSAASNFYGFDRVTMGGGGGSSNEGGGFIATNGGDGGGIVIIMTDILEGNAQSIYNSGESILIEATAGAGAGGAGGAILLDVNVYSGNLGLDVHGGNGGNASVDEQTGAGGGGGGGIVWHTGSGLPGNIAINTSLGAGGIAAAPELRGGNGGSGGTLGDLQLPLNGFLFNTIDGPDTICEGQQPKIILASTPRGRSTSYQYEWLQSIDDASWVSAIGTGDLLSFQPVELTTTTYFTRVVLDTLTDESNTPPEKYVYDTAFSIEVFVYHELTGNILANRDTVCYNQSSGTLSGSLMGGGDGSYNYNWHSSINGTSWTTGQSTQSTLVEDSLTLSTYYRRVVTSHRVCVDTSNVDEITVLSQINNNIFSPLADTAICENSDAGTVRATTASQLGGGDGNYSYQWMSSTDDNNFLAIPGATNADYSPGVLTDADYIYYHRIVYSGSDEVCENTTATSFFLEVYNSITNNSIDGSAIQYVCNNSEKPLTGSYPGEGSRTYNYIWEQWLAGTGWDDASGANNNHDYTSPALTDTISYRRLVLSGDYAQCKDTSNAVLIRINPLPIGDIIAGIDTFCAEGIITVNYNIAGNGPWSMTLGDGNPVHTEENISASSGEFSFNVSQTASIKVLDIEDDNACLAMDTNFVNTVEITIYEIPVANAGDDPGACGLSASMLAQPSVGSGEWSGADVQFEALANPASIVITDEYGIYYVTWSETNWQCTDANEIEINFFEQPLESDAGEDQNLDYQFNTILDAQIPDIGNGSWHFVTGTGFFEDSTLYNTRVDFTDIGNHELSWIINNGSCEAVSNSVQIVVGDLAIFKGFSPNGDGVNDEFILNMSGRNPAKLIIIDKWGRVMYEVTGRDELIWNGENMNGKIAPEGTYFYIIKEEGLTERKGYVELRK